MGMFTTARYITKPVRAVLSTLHMSTRSERTRQGIWARMCANFGVLERYRCHAKRVRAQRKLRRRMVRVCGEVQGYSPTVAWLMMKTRRTGESMRRRAPRKSRWRKGMGRKVRRLEGQKRSRERRGRRPIGPLGGESQFFGCALLCWERLMGDLLHPKRPSPVGVGCEETADDGTADAGESYDHSQDRR